MGLVEALKTTSWGYLSPEGPMKERTNAPKDSRV